MTPTTKPKPPMPPKAPPPAATNTSQMATGTTKMPGRLVRRELGRKILLFGMEGVGKTSLGAYAPDPLIVMIQNEKGYQTLMNQNRVPECDVVQLTKWTDALATFRELAKRELPYKTIVVDTIGGLERLCHEYVCETKFDGDWGSDKEKGFVSYAKGYDISIGEWKHFLDVVDIFHERGIHVLMLAHCQIRPFKNPTGPDYDSYQSDLHHKTWSATHRISEAVLFMNFLVDVKKEKGENRYKAAGGNMRVVYTEHHDAYHAKNTFGMPPVIQMPDDPAEMWNTLDYYMSQGRLEVGQAQEGAK